MEPHNCAAREAVCRLNSWGYCTLAPIIEGFSSEYLVFMRYLFISGRFDTDCDPSLYTSADNIAEFQAYANGLR